MPRSEVIAPAKSRAAVAIAARWNPVTSSAPPTIAASTATAMSPAIRATALFTAEAIPERSVDTAPRTAAVSGATVAYNPSPMSSMLGSICHG